MSFRILFALLISSLLAGPCSQPALAKPTWTFRVVVAVEKQTATYFQNRYGKPIEQLVQAQMATINANFNNSTSHFNGVYNFQPDSIYVFDGPAQNEVSRPHPRFAYCVVIDGKFTESTMGGGWWGNYQTVYHSWQWDYMDGPFGQTATDGLTHELGHARGAIDIYGLRVEGAKNPVNGQTFEPVNSVMNYPYGNVVWDEYTTNLLNSTIDSALTTDQWILRPFPRNINLRAVLATGATLDGVRFEVYPVEWFSYAVGAASIQNLYSGANGIAQFPSNPFQPGSAGRPWLMRYSNFLIKATYNSVVAYQWLPLYEVQNAYFRNGPNEAYTAEFVFPANTPSITLSSVNVSHLCPGATMQATFSSTGVVDAGNQFMLMFIDKFNNSYEIGTLTGNGGGTISGKAPYLSPGDYTVKVYTTNRSIQSNAWPITLDPSPAKPTTYSLTVCQNSTPQPLQATGQDLRWYGTDGTSLPTAPVPNTSRLGNQFYYVTQTIDGCESDKAALQVAVQTTPTLSITGTTTTNIGIEVPIRLLFTGPGPYSYTLSTGQTGTASRDTTLLVLPDRTTTYQVQQVRNTCGTGVAVGSGATISVLVPRIQTLALANPALCGGSSLTVSYQTTGSFNQGNSFTLQLAKVGADSASATFTNIVTSQLSSSAVAGTVPIGIPAGSYWVRVLATNPKIPVIGTISPTVLTVLPQPTATLASSQTIIAGQSATLSVALTGNSPWTFTYHDSTTAGAGRSQSVQTTTNPHSFSVNPMQTTAYVLSSVSNGCGNGSVTGGSVVVMVSPLLGVEDELLAQAVDVFPVPATTSLSLRLNKPQPASAVSVTLVNLAGQPLLQRDMRTQLLTLPLDLFPAGHYVLRIQVGDRTLSKRVVKY